MNDSSSRQGALLCVSGLAKSYPHAGGAVEVLHDVHMTAQAGEVVAVVGSSGAGKSTLLHVIGTLDHADRGTVEILGQDTSTLADEEISRFRNMHIGFVFQFHHLLPEFTALDNTALPFLIHGGDAKEANCRARDLLDRVGLGHRLTHRPAQLSGGEQQRVALARALVMRPELVLADEPTGNLDPRTGGQVHEIFMEVSREMGAAVIVATHNPDLARRSDRRLRLRGGMLEEE